MKKFIKKLALAVVALLTFSVGSNYTVKEVKAAETEVVFNLGANGTAKHYDGSGTTTYSKTVDGYTLSITGGTNMYTGARDAKGNSCIKMGTSSKAGSFTISNISDDVTSVIIDVAAYKANSATVKVNGITTTLKTKSNNGQYDAINVDTSSTKTISFAVSSGYRCMVNTITYVIPDNSGSGEPEVPVELTNEEKIAKSLTAVKNTIDSFYASQSTIELPASNEDYGTIYLYALEGDSNVYVKNSNSLIVNPTNALKEATLTVTASVNGVEDSLDVIINSASNTEVLPLVEAVKVAKFFGETYSSDKFYVEGDIQKVYNTTYGNLYIQDESVSSDFTVYGLYDKTGKTRYDAMEVKPIAGDTVKLYGILGTYSSTAQMKNAWLIEHTVNYTDKELIAMEKTTASLAFDYSLTYEEQYVEAGTFEESVTFSEEGYTNQQEVKIYDGQNFDILFDKGVNTNTTTKYYDSGTALRVYYGNVVTISSDSLITKVVIKFGSYDSSNGNNTITCDVGTYSNGTWTGSSNSVSFTIGKNSSNETKGHRRFAGITVITESSGTQDVLVSSTFTNISILFGASVKTSLFEDFTTVKAGVMFSAGSALDVEKAIKKEVETLVENDGFYSVGAELEVFAENVLVTDETKTRLSQNITAAVYFVVDGETVILDEKTVSVESMVNTYLTEYATNDSVKAHKDALEALKTYIEAE